LPETERFSAEGKVQEGSQSFACEAEVAAEGLTLRRASGEEETCEGWQIREVRREGYTIEVSCAPTGSVLLHDFKRRTDELETALRRCRADAFASLMTPPGQRPLEVVEARGEDQQHAYLYRSEDGLRWVPSSGPCFARLYGELEGAHFDRGSYTLTLHGPFGDNLLAGLARRTTELEHEVGQRVAEARHGFAESLEQAGLGWADEARSGAIRQHVPFEATEERLVVAETLVVEERREYWEALREEGLIERLLVSCGEEGELRLVAVCAVTGGELYEVLSEADHASFVFKCADPVVRAWTEVGFRREPIFEQEAEQWGPYETLAEVLPSLAEARASLVRRLIHDSVGSWRSALA
jgi:hypothetical protein